MNVQWMPFLAGIAWIMANGGQLLAKDPTGGLATDAALGPFESVKCGGAINDGVEIGEHVCYRSRNSSRPQVIVFAHQMDQLPLLDELAKSLDAQMESTSSLRVFINVLGSDLAATKKRAGEWSEKLGLKQVAVVVPLEHAHGPEAYHLDQDALLTVIVAKRSRVVATRSAHSESEMKSLSKALSTDLEKL